jgi:allantoinase
MFYGLHGRSNAQNDFLRIGPEERYDIAHFEFIMRSARRLMTQHPKLADYVSVSLHCELAEILNAYTEIVEHEGKLTGLHAYSAARPPHSEGLATWIASYLANETDCLNINLLHLRLAQGGDAAWTMQQVFPHNRFPRRVHFACSCPFVNGEQRPQVSQDKMARFRSRRLRAYGGAA